MGGEVWEGGVWKTWEVLHAMMGECDLSPGAGRGHERILCKSGV